MSTTSSSPTRRSVLVASAAAAAASLLPAHPAVAAENAAIRPFRVHVPEQDLVDLRRRIAATRWPDRETVNDRSQGVQLAKFQEVVRYWGTDYDWRKAEAQAQRPAAVHDRRSMALDIHFIHVRSRHPNALPLIMTHGWPGSVFELLKTIGPLTDPDGPRWRARRTPSTW